MKTLSILSLLLSGIATAFAQRQAVAPPQTERITLSGGTLHTGSGQVIENALVMMDSGKIKWAGSALNVKTEETLGKVIDCSGKHLYPGLIAMGTTLGLTEIEAVRSTRDHYETGSMNPNAKASIAYNTDSKVTPTVRSNGILYAQIAPEGGRISGTSALVQLDAWNWEDALIREGEGIFLNWPSVYVNHGWWAEPGGSSQNKDYENQVLELEKFFRDARSYFTAHDELNPRFEAMNALWSGQSRLYVAADETEAILHALQFCESHQIKPVIYGGRGSWRIAAELAKKKIPVVLHRTHLLPESEDEDIDQPFKTASILQKAGVEVALASPGEFWQTRNLPFYAGTAAAYGLNKEEALKMITLNAAKIMQLDSRIGSIAAGKDASIVVSNGDLLDMRSNQIVYAFIEGRSIDLSNKQQELYQLYCKKYGIKP